MIDTTITVPAKGSSTGAAPVPLGGTATASAGVAEVRVAVQDRLTKLWWRSDGTWGAWQQFAAVVAAPGATTSAWSVPWTAPGPGAYAVQAETRDLDGAGDATRAWVNFTWGAAPDAAVTFPQGNATVSSPVTLTGTAVDDTGVSAVRIAIQDRVTMRWWQPNGTWGAWRQLNATVAGSGTPSATWTYPWTAPGPGTYAVQVEAVDAFGVVDPSRAFRPFTVRAPGPALLTLAIGRADWGASDDCTVAEGAVPLDRIAAELAARGRTAAVGVVSTTTAEDTRRCQGGAILQASWADLTALRDAYGWTVFQRPNGPLSLMTPQQQVAETCGALPSLAARGHDRAWGLLAYANNTTDATIQTDLVSTCFAFGRAYGNGLTTRNGIGPPFWQSTRSFNGGACNDPTLDCYGLVVTGSRRYESPELLAALLAPTADTWRTVQLYRFVEGAHSGPGGAWDCTSPDWRGHWTSRAELYCVGDFLWAVDRIPAGVTVTDPAGVAALWGRVP